LFYAAAAGHTEIMKKFISAFKKKNPQNNSQIIMEQTNPFSLNLKSDTLLDFINHLDYKGQTALFYAIEEGHESSVKMLLDNGASTNIIDKNGFSLLHCAVWSQNPNMPRHENVFDMVLEKIELEGLMSKGKTKLGSESPIDTAKRLESSRFNK
jgi:hypothetical protein